MRVSYYDDATHVILTQILFHSFVVGQFDTSIGCMPGHSCHAGFHVLQRCATVCQRKIYINILEIVAIKINVHSETPVIFCICKH